MKYRTESFFYLFTLASVIIIVNSVIIILPVSIIIYMMGVHLHFLIKLFIFIIFSTHCYFHYRYIILKIKEYEK